MLHPPGRPFLLCWLAIPGVSARVCMLAAAVTAASIKLTYTRISKRPVPALQRLGICQFCLHVNLALLGVSRLHQPRTMCPSLYSLKMTRNNHKKGTKGLQINLPSLAPLTQRYDYKPRICRRPKFLINLHYRFYHCFFFFRLFAFSFKLLS